VSPSSIGTTRTDFTPVDEARVVLHIIDTERPRVGEDRLPGPVLRCGQERHDAPVAQFLAVEQLSSDIGEARDRAVSRGIVLLEAQTVGLKLFLDRLHQKAQKYVRIRLGGQGGQRAC
jgi:hypothetical protein